MTPEQQAAILRAQQRAAIQRAQAQLSSQPAPAVPHHIPQPRAFADEAPATAGGFWLDRPQPERPAIPEGFVLDPQTGQYTTREWMAGNMAPGRADAALTGAAQGISLGFADEIVGGMGALVGQGDFQRERARARLDAARRDQPGATLAGEVGGALAIPAGPAASAATVPGAVVRGAAAGGLFGAGYGAGTAEGGLEQRATGATQGAALGALFGAGAGAAINVGTRTFRRLFQKSTERPTVQNLRAAKDAAYRAVDESGETFTLPEMQALRERVQRELQDPIINFVPETDLRTVAALRMIDSVSDRPMTIGQLDRVRRRLFDRLKAAPDEIGIRRMIDAIDDTIASHPGGSELMQAARAAHSRFKKAEVLQDAFDRATRQTSRTGSGGNTLNNFRAAVDRVLNNKRDGRWFTPDERAVMQQFVRGDMGQNMLRRIGKLSPSGNGLMLALNLFGAGAFGAPAIAVGAAGAAARHISDRGAREGADMLIQRMATGAQRAAQPTTAIPRGINALSGLMGDRFAQ